MSDQVILEAVVLGGLMGAIVLVGAAFWFGGAPLAVRTPMLLACGAGLAYILGRWPLYPLIFGQSPAFAESIKVVGASAAGFFWAFAMAVFRDRPASHLRYAPAAALLAAQAINAIVPQSWDAIWDPAVNLFIAVVAGHTLFLTLHGWRGDLMEGRRRLRLPLLGFFALSALLVLILAAEAALSEAGFRSDWTRSLVTLVRVLFLIPCALLVEGRPLFSEPGVARASGPSDAEDDQTLKRLAAVMRDQQAWRSDDLSIERLAGFVGVPEHRLRRLINGKLGHRNFSAFVNGYRIEAAKQLLASKDAAERTVADIAFEVGFGSLGPFNRAFKDVTGMTPTAWRASPNPKTGEVLEFGETIVARKASRRI